MASELRQQLARANAQLANADATPAAKSFLDAARETAEDEYLNAHPLKDAAQWLGEPDEQPSPLIEGLIERGSCVAIVGPAKSAKTWLEIQTAVSIATGRDWLGNKTTRQIVYVANIEVSSRQYKKRLKSICKKYAVDPSELQGRLFIDNLRGEKATFALCLARAKAANADVVIIDPFYQVFKGSERDDLQCQEAIEDMKAFLKLGMTLIMVFHAPKGLSGDRQIVDMISGSSVLVRFPENVVAILPHATDKNARVIDCSVLRDYAPPDPFTVKLEDGALVLAPDIAPELKSGHASNRYKSVAEREKEKQDRHNAKQKEIETGCLAFLEKRGDNLPGTGELFAVLHKIGPKGEVEEYLRSAKESGALATEAERVRDGNGGWKVKSRKNCGKILISTPARINAYRRKIEELPL